MSQIDHQQLARERELRIAAAKAGNPFVSERTFAAKDHPKGSPERARLNENPVTSDKKGDFPFVLQRAGAAPEYFVRYLLAHKRLSDLIRPFYAPAHLPFGGGTPPVPSDPDEVIATGEYAGKSLGEAHADHFRPGESAEAFFERRAKELERPPGPNDINPDWSVAERDQQARDKPLEDAVAAAAKARGIHVPEGKLIVTHIK